MSTTIYLVVGSKGEYDDFCEWVVKAFSDQTAAELHAQELTDEQTQRNELREKASVFQNEWADKNPSPKYPEDLLWKEKKWPAGIRQRDITPLMRKERNDVRDYNTKVLAQYQEKHNAWRACEVEATKTFLTTVGATLEMIETIVGVGYYMYEHSANYGVEETQLD